MDGMTITLPNNIVKMVAETAKKKSIPTMEVLRRMFTILKITQEEKAKGNALGIVNGDRVVVRFVGI
jgi:ribosome-binding protein aMBF1 (putative translation factor)